MKHMRSLFTPPVFEGDEELTYHTRLLHATLWTYIVSSTIAAICLALALPENAPRVLTYAGIVDVTSLALVGLTRSGYTRLASSLLVLVLWLVTTFYALGTEGIREPALGGYILIVSIAGLLLGSQMGAVAGVICSLTGLGMVYAENVGALPLAPVQQTPLSIWIINVVLIVIISSLQSLATTTIKTALQQAQQELTERRQVEVALRASEAQYRMLIEESPTGIGILEADESSYRITVVNPTGCEILGYSEEEIIGMNATRLVDSGDLARQSLPSLEEMQSGKTIRRERLIPRKDGMRISVLGSFKQMPDGRFLYIFQDITDRKKNEQELRDNEQRYRALFEQSNDAIAIMSLDRKIIATNKQDIDLFGYSEAETVGRDAIQTVLTPELDDARDKFEQVIAGKILPLYERIFIRKDGTELITEINLSLIRDATGEPWLVQSIIRDITKRKRVEEHLRESEARYRAVIENQTEFIVRWKPDATRTFVNEAYCRYFALTHEQALSTSFLPLIVEEDRFAMEERISRLISGTVNTETYIHRVSKPDGSIGWQEWTDQVIQGELGKVTEIQSVGRDITERKRADEELRRSEEKFRQLITSAPDAIIGANQEGQIIFASVEATTLLGYEPEELTSMNIEALMPARFRADHTAKYAGYMTNPHPRMRAGLELFATRKDGSEVPVDINLSRLDTEAGSLVTAFIRDITVRKHAEEKLRQRADQMSALYDIGLSITSNLDLNQIFRDLFEKCKSLLPIDKFYVALYDESTYVVTHPLYFVSGEYIHLPPRDIREIPGLSGHVITSRQTLYVPDMESTVAQEKYGIVFTSGVPSRSYVGAPMFFRNEIIGLIAMQHVNPDAYSSEQIRLLETIATQAAVAIANAKLYREALQAAERRTVLHRISQDIVRFMQDTEQIYTAIHEAASKLMSCDVFIIALRDEVRQENVMVYAVEDGLRYERIRMPASQGFSGAVINEGESLILRNSDEIEHLQFAHFGSPQHVQSAVAVPMRIGDKVMGMTSAQCYKPYTYGAEEQVLLEMLSTHAAIAIENARLYEVEQKRREEAETLRESLASIVTTFELEEVVERILDQIKFVIPYDTASIWRVNGEWQTLIVGRDLPPEVSVADLKFRVDSNNSSRPIVQGEKSFILNNNVQAELTDFRGPHSYINSWLAVPLKKRNNIIGVIALDGRNKDQFTTHHAELAVTFADQVAIALENASLFEAEQLRRKEAETLRRAATTISSTLDTEAVLKEVMAALKQVIPYDSGSIFFHEASQLRIALAEGYPDAQQLKGQAFPDNDEFFQAAITTGQPIILKDAQQDTRFKKWGDSNSIRGWIVVPLITRGRVIGAITLDSLQPEAFDEHIGHTAMSFAYHAAAAIENARLYTEIQQELTARNRAEEEIQQLNAELENRVNQRTTQLQVTNEALLREKARLERYARDAGILNSLNDLLQASLTTDEASHVISRHIQRLFPGKSGGLYLNGSSGLEATLIWGDRPELDMIFPPDDCWALRRGRVYSWSPAQVGPMCQHLVRHPPQASLCLPLLAQGDTLGTLHLQTHSADEVSNFLDDSHLRLAETVANNIALALANLRLRETLRRQTIIDSMTGLYNLRYMEEVLTREIHRAKRHQHTISVLMFDVDNFKRFNDTFGHDGGDFVLRKFGELLQTSTRTGDIPCHPHGEEFTLILPETEIEAACQLAERLRFDTEHLTVHYNGQALGTITVSIGVATFPGHGDSWQAVLKAADDAMYEAKKAGKNRVAVVPVNG